jgi:ATP-dependent RNA helicase RhlE
VSSVSFVSLGIAEPLLRALVAETYTTPTPLQTQAIPLLLEGRDLLGLAQTGTGKTAAFGLPLLQKLAANRTRHEPRSARALILAPTRELALQIHDSLKTYGRHLGLKYAVVLGGVKQGSQVKALANGVDVLVATPGRLLDLVSQKHLRLDHVLTLVVDEADRMFDMGFVRDLRKIVAMLPRERQSMLFSATMPDAVAKLTGEILRQPVRVEAAPPSKPAEGITQLVYYLDAKDKRGLLQKLLRDPAFARVIVFARTKHSANRIAEHLVKAGTDAEAIHGNKSQNARVRALDRFRSGSARVLVATDIAARGIDVDGITHVINFELPEIADSYVHRIGRTARAGATGTAISFCDPSERGHLRQIEKETRMRLKVANDPREDARRAA